MQKKDGRVEAFNREKIQQRLQRATPTDTPIESLVQQIEDSLPQIIPWYAIDDLIARTAASSLTTMHLAGYVEATRLQRDTEGNLLVLWHAMARHDPPLIDASQLPFIQAHEDTLQAALDEAAHRETELTYFGLMTLQKNYLLRTQDGEILERPNMLFMRVAIGLHAPNVSNVLKTFHALSQRECMHATPTLFNAGTNRPQLSSCFLTNIKDDSLAGIYDTLKDCALISKHAGGIGLSITNVRGTDSYIRGTQGRSSGLLPMLKVFNATARYVDQGGKRKGSFAVYLEPWHTDIEGFLEARLPGKSDESSAVDLFYGLWIPDHFMNAVKDDALYYLMCPSECPGLDTVWGTEFEELYQSYVEEGRYRRCIQARELWVKILQCQCETGLPYMLYKDSVNRKSPQQHLGTIRCSNLCTEITLYTEPGKETAVCNLASICLPKYLNGTTMDLERLGGVVEDVVENLNQVIDRNLYPTPESEHSNRQHRPIGLGVQGLSDVYMRMNLPFESAEAIAVDRSIFECMYYHALRKSCALAQRDGPHASFPNSLAAKGLLQYDLWHETEVVEDQSTYDWAGLKRDIVHHGLRNSCLMAPMPTASTSQISGSVCEGIDPLTANLLTRHTLSGNFLCSNPILIERLEALGLWSDTMEQTLIQHRGSVQKIDGLPNDVKAVFKTCYELKMRWVIDHARARAPFVDQSMSMNLYFATPSVSTLSSCHMYAWSKGLKTGMYYLRQKPASEAAAFSMNTEECLSCGS